MKALVVGSGSAGQRHARVLGAMGLDVAVVSRRADRPAGTFADLRAGLTAHAPGYVVVANRTGDHADTVAELAAAGFDGTVLVEKPLFHTAIEMGPLPFRDLFVAYNLRFHPGVVALRDAVAGDRALSVMAYAGQYLPDWRPDRDYRTGYATTAADGGGVLRDLSHELDYLAWIFGDWTRLTALGGRLGSLEIETDDCFSITQVTERCPLVECQLNYLDRAGRRIVIVNAERHTYALDLVRGTFSRDGESVEMSEDADTTWRSEHEAALSGDHVGICTMAEGMRVLETIEAAERCAREKIWVER